MFEINIEDLRKSLHGTTPCHFSFMKKDGTMRNAVGSLNEKFIPEDMLPKDPSANFTGDNLKYFDLDKKAWRSLSKDCSLIQIIE
ncbi:MAG: SH3 beta-barrel fold-containing protein [Novosphingobium sp.]|nr:SH3 beta-barrel fold-containing protein [Novosphingobium sp.]